jgi:hypothetical protein
MSRNDLLALADRIRARDADMKRRGGKIQRVFRDEMPMVIEALEKAAAENDLSNDEGA